MLLLLCFLVTGKVVGQDGDGILKKIKNLYHGKEYLNVVNQCEATLDDCGGPEAPNYCGYNVMYQLHEFLGIAQYQLWKSTQHSSYLAQSINSLKTSYSFHADPDVMFNLGMRLMDLAILKGDGANLTGIEKAWKGIIGKQALAGGQVNQFLVRDILAFIEKVENLTITPPHIAATPGDFAAFMVRLACSLARESSLDETLQSHVRVHSALAEEDNKNLRGNLWWNKSKKELKKLKSNYSDSIYYEANKQLGWAHKYAKTVERKVEVLNNRAKIALKAEQAQQTIEERIQVLRDALLWIEEAYAHVELIEEPEVKKSVELTYGQTVTRLIITLTTEYENNMSEKLNSLEQAIQIGKEFWLNNEPSNLKFVWHGVEWYYFYLSQTLYSLPEVSIENAKSAYDTAVLAWQIALKSEGIQEREICGNKIIDEQKKVKFRGFLKNGIRVTSRFGYSTYESHLRGNLNCLNKKS